MTHLVLIGPRGSGKTEVGKRVARLLGWAFVDTDVLIEARGRTIADLFATEGEPGFRAVERAVIKSLDLPVHAVIATGGGAVLDAANRERLGALGPVIYLRASVERLVARIAGSDRPPLTDADPADEMRQVLALRETIYGRLASVVLDTDDLDLDTAARRVVQRSGVLPEAEDRGRGPRG